MRFGICTGIENAEILKNLGYDYIELGLSKIAELSADELTDYRGILDNYGLQAESFNGFFPQYKIVGPEADFEKIEQYAEKALERAAVLGGRAVVLGCGNQRRIPEGETFARVYEDFVKTARIVGRAAAKNGIVIALEPLNKLETDFFHTVEEGLQIMRDVNLPSVKVLADMYHVCRENEDFSHIVAAGKDLVHVHIAQPEKRGYPTPQDDFDYGTFAAALQKAGYHGRISVEGHLDGELEQEGAVALRLLKNTFC